MRRWLLRVALVAIVSCAADPAMGRPAKTDKQRLQGSWVIKEYKFQGMADASQNGTVWTFTGDKLKSSRSNQAWAYKIYPRKKPKAIDVMFDPKKPREKFKGSYWLEGDTLKVVLPIGAADQRPKKFAGGWQLYTFERQQP